MEPVDRQQEMADAIAKAEENDTEEDDAVWVRPNKPNKAHAERWGHDE